MNTCTGIPANPDIAGIGVRVSIYVQSFITLFYPSFALALSKLTGFRWDPARVASVRAARYALLATGFGLLISAVVQAKAFQLTVYHALIILNLNWIIALTAWTSAVYALLSIGLSETSTDAPTTRDRMPRPDLTGIFTRLLPRLRQRLNASTSVPHIGLTCAVHLTFTSAIGIWLFHNVAHFDATTPECTPGTVYLVFGHQVPLSSRRLRTFWLAMYAMGVVPLLNVMLLAIAEAQLATVIVFPVVARRMWSRVPLDFNFSWAYPLHIVYLLITLALNCILIASTEGMVAHNLVLPGEDQWTFGQTLSLFLVVPGVWSCVQEIQIIREQLNEKTQKASLPGTDPSLERKTCDRQSDSRNSRSRRFSV